MSRMQVVHITWAHQVNWELLTMFRITVLALSTNPMQLLTGSRVMHLVLVFLRDVRVLGVAGGGNRDEAVGGGCERGCGGRPRLGLTAAVQQRLAQRLQLLQLGLVHALALILALLVQPVLHNTRAVCLG